MGRNRRDLHHFLPKHLLRNWAAPDGLVTVYDKEEDWKPRRDKPDNLAAENSLYAPGSTDDSGRDPKDDAFERWLADEIDGPAAQPIAKLAKGTVLEDLSADELHAVADFFAVLDMRTPRIRDMLVPVFEDGVREAASDYRTARRTLRQKGVRVSSKEARRVSKRQREVLPRELGKPAWLDYIKTIRPIARLNVKDRRWSLLVAPPSTAFLTNDLGIAKSITGPLEPVSWAPGTQDFRLHWVIPISPCERWR